MRIRVKDIDTGKWHVIDVPVNQENPSGGTQEAPKAVPREDQGQ